MLLCRRRLWPGASALLGLAFALLLQGCDIRQLERAVSAEEHRHNQPRHIVCEALEFSIPRRGIVRVDGSQLGASPSVTCPPDYVYSGPRLECSIVDRTCIAADKSGAEAKRALRGEDKGTLAGRVQEPCGDDCDLNLAVGARNLAGLCWNEYNVTLAGQALVDWPAGLATRGNVTDSTAEAPRSASGGPTVRNTTALPRAVSPDLLRCAPEPYVDLDFHGSEVVRPSSPPSSWSLRFRSIAAADEVGAIDLLVTRVDRSWAPGDPEQDGKGSMMGVVSIGGGAGEVSLRFRFVRSSTPKPITLSKFYFTVFDVSDGIDGFDDKEVTVSGISEYFVSVATRVAVANKEHGEFEFSSSRSREKAGRSDVRKMWQSSLHGTVAFMFRNTSEFTLKVRAATPGEKLRRFEFAGWSEIVKYGRKVFSVPRQRPVIAGVGNESAGSQVDRTPEQLVQ